MKSTHLLGLIGAGWALLLVGLIVRSSMEMSLGAGMGLIVHTWWGITTLVDLYAGLALVACWIAYRERSAVHAAPWIVGLVLLGNLATLIYVVIAAARAGSMNELILGRR